MYFKFEHKKEKGFKTEIELSGITVILEAIMLLLQR